MAVGSFSLRDPVPSLASVAPRRPGVGSYDDHGKEDCHVKVSEVMTKKVVTVGPHYNVADVASLMDAKGIGSVIVLEEERVLGILTERDILKVIGAGEDPKNVAAHEALIGDLYTITPGASIEDDQIVGIISIRDVVRWSVREMAQATELPHMDVSQKVLSIVHPGDAAAG